MPKPHSQESIIAIITELLAQKKAFPEDVEIQSFRFYESGHIDSLGVMSFVASLESALDIEITDEEMMSDAFQSVGGLSQLIASKS